MVFKEAELWDGKDAPTMPDEEGYDDDEEAPSQNSDQVESETESNENSGNNEA